MKNNFYLGIKNESYALRLVQKENLRKCLSVKNHFIRFRFAFFYLVPTYLNSHNTLFLSPIRESKTTVFETTVMETMLCDAVPLRAKSPETAVTTSTWTIFFFMSNTLVINNIIVVRIEVIAHENNTYSYIR